MLEKIAARVRERLEEDLRTLPREALWKKARSVERHPLDLARALRGPFPAIIAEVKLASPSEGDIAVGADPVAVATEYLENGAAALSVLTERDFFKGQPEYLAAIREAHPTACLLMKDFVTHEDQIARARVLGADAVLLIVALLGAERTMELLKVVRDLGLSALVEVHDEAELRIAHTSGAKIIGVNNRDLKTMKVLLDTSERLAGALPKIGAKLEELCLVAESGLKSGNDLKRLSLAGFQGFLIGTHFMRSPSPGEALRRMIRDSNPQHPRAS